jgi:excisionase family DNA binding protein
MGKDFTTSEAAIELGITAGRVRQMIVDGELKATKHGRDLVITAAALDRAKKRKTAPGPVAKKKRSR